LKEVTLLNSKLANMTKSIKMLNKGSDMLDVIVEISKKSGNVQGIEFDYNSMNKNVKNPPKKFVSSEKKSEYQSKGPTSNGTIQDKHIACIDQSSHFIHQTLCNE
jgi:hypothetical protein